MFQLFEGRKERLNDLTVPMHLPDLQRIGLVISGALGRHLHPRHSYLKLNNKGQIMLWKTPPADFPISDGMQICHHSKHLFGWIGGLPYLMANPPPS